ncbi:hypothetical protein [Xylanimonas protaetiae]|uniref:Uncharacterized protein n=1 Tax=Xylanimonas protaetiae TaxID=2509457 RepID=A0A4P6F6D9_9MICO|nr:hypothetical protein [Xylanimonas protaetiae]QAY69879.1 hypothetical protein ET471_07390 [Xylanimonas protaetiae]
MTGGAAGSKDRAYCVDALDALRRLEANRYRRNEAARELERQARRRWTAWSFGVALVLPVLVWAYFLASEAGFAHLHQFPARTAGVLVASVFLLVVGWVAAAGLGSTRLFAGVRDQAARGPRGLHAREVAAADAAARRILAEPTLSEGRIPDRYLSPRMVSMLLRFFDAGQATFLESAVYMLDAELRGSAHYRNLVPAETTASRERERLAGHPTEGGQP